MLLTPHITKRTNARAVKKSWQRVQGVGNTTLLKTETKNLLFSAFYPSNSFIRQTLSLRTMLKLSSARAISFPASPHAHTAHSTGMHVVVVVAPRRPRLVTRRLASRTHTTIVQPGTICSVNVWSVYVWCLYVRPGIYDDRIRDPGAVRRPGNKAASKRSAGGRERLSTRLCPLQWHRP